MSCEGSYLCILNRFEILWIIGQDEIGSKNSDFRGMVVLFQFLLCPGIETMCLVGLEYLTYYV